MRFRAAWIGLVALSMASGGCGDNGGNLAGPPLGAPVGLRQRRRLGRHACLVLLRSGVEPLASLKIADRLANA